MAVQDVNDLYKKIEKLGEGSYAVVYKSESRIDGTIVALKEIKLHSQEGLPFTAIREGELDNCNESNSVLEALCFPNFQKISLKFIIIVTSIQKLHFFYNQVGNKVALSKRRPFGHKLLLFNVVKLKERRLVWGRERVLERFSPILVATASSRD
ncbi:unnamed protein product [Anisakis simplex]|uniref:Protein kinase domain-containing protein n=1 Tax=Anisakis simplex TaxID=6269 RepID=A0A3P6PV21_ANISI|nr:unnamed protein product [Anisakis simplex]